MRVIGVRWPLAFRLYATPSIKINPSLCAGRNVANSDLLKILLFFFFKNPDDISMIIVKNKKAIFIRRYKEKFLFLVSRKNTIALKVAGALPRTRFIHELAYFQLCGFLGSLRTLPRRPHFQRFYNPFQPCTARASACTGLGCKLKLTRKKRRLRRKTEEARPEFRTTHAIRDILLIILFDVATSISSLILIDPYRSVFRHEFFSLASLCTAFRYFRLFSFFSILFFKPSR